MQTYICINRLTWKAKESYNPSLMEHLSTTLNWESSYAIALELHRQHRDVILEEVTLNQIYEWTIKLPKFEDDPSLCNDEILYAIYQDWYEESIHEQ